MSELVAEQSRKIGRPSIPAEERKQNVTLRIAPEIIAHYKAAGRGWNARMEEVLRKGMSDSGE